MKARWSLSILVTMAAACGSSSGRGPEDAAVAQDVADATDATPDAPPLRKLPFAAWQDLREALRSSPDHLAARADEVVAAKDAQRIYAFVRDLIAAHPARAKDFGLGADREAVWGPAMTLRSGTGTPREKVELLADLYHRAGFEADVWSGDNALSPDLRRACLFAKPIPDFAPGNRDAIDTWRKELGGGVLPTPLATIDKDATDSLALAARIEALLPPTAVAQPLDLSGFDTMPFVRVVVDGQEKFANPLPPDGVFGETYTTGTTGPAPSATGAQDELHVALSYATADEPGTLKPLIEGDWALADLAGRRLRVQMVPTEDIDTLALMPIDSVRSFFPVLALDAPGLEPDEIASHSIAGTSAVTLAGQLITVDATGTLTVDGEPVANGTADPATLASVASIEVAADPVAFPRIRLQALVRDAGGNMVSGLGASAFRVQDEGEGRGFVMDRNRAPGPRVLILLDVSDSIPLEFREQAGVYAQDLATAILTDHPNALFRVAAVAFGAAAAGEWTADPSEVKAQADMAPGAASDLWAALAEAGDLGGTVIVYTTDGDPDTPDTPEEKLRIAHGPPVVVVGVGTVVPATLAEMAALSGGTLAMATQPSDVATATLTFLGKQVVDPYRLAYQAPTGATNVRHVSMKTSDGRVEGTATYTVPDPAMRLPEPAITGLYLTVDWGIQSVTRTLAGFDRAPGTTPSATAALEVQEAMFGTAILSVEGGAPTLAARLDDVLAAKLALEPLWDAAVSGDTDAIRAALITPIATVSADLAGIAAPLAAADSTEPTYETGPRLVLLTVRPEFGIGRTRRIDVLPLAGFATISVDPARALRRTLEATARLAVMEQALFTTSTASLLEGADLALLNPYDNISVVAPGLDGAARSKWEFVMDRYWDEYRIVPTSGTPVAFYSVDPETGRMIAVLPDGSGGGSATDDIQKALNGGSRGLAALSVLGSMAGGGFGLGGFIALQKAILKAILREAAAVEALDATGLADDLGKIARDAGCDLAKEAVGAKFAPFGKANDADAVVEAATGSGLMNCF
jgi:hypothetical protein